MLLSVHVLSVGTTTAQENICYKLNSLEYSINMICLHAVIFLYKHASKKVKCMETLLH